MLGEIYWAQRPLNLHEVRSPYQSQGLQVDLLNWELQGLDQNECIVMELWQIYPWPVLVLKVPGETSLFFLLLMLPFFLSIAMSAFFLTVRVWGEYLEYIIEQIFSCIYSWIEHLLVSVDLLYSLLARSTLYYSAKIKNKMYFLVHLRILTCTCNVLSESNMYTRVSF